MPSHLTLRRWQASQALLTEDDMASAVGREKGRVVDTVEMEEAWPGEREERKNGEATTDGIWGRVEKMI
jgi:hypothetical protein